jgi:hypothetical protein
MYSYTAYGLEIHSEIPLAALPPGSSPADIQIRRASVVPPPELNGHSIWTGVNDIYLRFENVGLVRVSGGREIVVDAEGVDDRMAASFVLGPSMGVLLHQRGLLVLHASAVLTDAGVVAFLGHSGWGKSTMAGALGKLGYPLFSDDVVPVSLSNGLPIALPSYPFLKLGKDSGAKLGYETGESATVLPEDGRLQIAVRGVDPDASVPLARLYVLGEGERPEIELLKPQESAPELIRHSYAAPCLGVPALGAFHLKSCAALVGKVPIYRLRRPRRLELLQDLAEMVQRDFQTVGANND